MDKVIDWMFTFLSWIAYLILLFWFAGASISLFLFIGILGILALPIILLRKIFQKDYEIAIDIHTPWNVCVHFVRLPKEIIFSEF